MPGLSCAPPTAMPTAVMEPASPSPHDYQRLSQAGMGSGQRAAPHPLPVSRGKQKGLSVTSSPGSKSLLGQSSEVEGKAAGRSCPTWAEPGTLPVSEPWSESPACSFAEDSSAFPTHLEPQDLLSTGPGRIISAAPPKQTLGPAFSSTSRACPHHPTLATSCPGRRLMVPLGPALVIPPAAREMLKHHSASPNPEPGGSLTLGTAALPQWARN